MFESALQQLNLHLLNCFEIRNYGVVLGCVTQLKAYGRTLSCSFLQHIFCKTGLLQVFDKEGRFKFQFGECGKRDGQLLYPNRLEYHIIFTLWEL